MSAPSAVGNSHSPHRILWIVRTKRVSIKKKLLVKGHMYTKPEQALIEKTKRMQKYNE